MKSRALPFSLMIAGMLSICVFVWAADKPCKVPSASTKKCFHPSNMVTDCTAWPGAECVGRSMYVVRDFPDGTTPADTGTTAEDFVDCYQETKCRQKEGDATKCVAADPLPYVLEAKTIVGTGICPTE